MEQLLQDVFLAVLNMSITASYVILFILLIRVFLKKAPKIFSYSLWSVVLFRLVCPISFSSALSFLVFLKTDTMEHIPRDLGRMTQPQVDVGMDGINQAIKNSLPAATATFSASPIQIILFIISVLWALGVLSLLTYSVVSYLLLKRKVSAAMLIKDNIFECENIQSPFVLGIIKPRIYLPIGFSDMEKSYILKHEEIHIRRFDYLIKPFAFLVLCIHWFNPIVWVSFILMNKDMEMSCDEHVIREMGIGIKKDYSRSLLSLAASRKIIGASPLAFVEGNAKSRIKNVLNYKKSAFWLVFLAIIAITVVSIGLMTNPAKSTGPDLSFLNIKNTASMAIQQESLIIRKHGRGAAAVNGSKFGEWLNDSSKDWTEAKEKGLSKLVPTFTVYIDSMAKHEVRFYELEHPLAVIWYDGEYRCYAISEEDCKEINMMHAISSYYVPEVVMKAIVDGKRTRIPSVGDVPVEGDYKEIRILNNSRYLYQSNGKYYCEAPYMFIDEISEEVYKDALEFAEEPIKEQKEKVSSELAELVESKLAEIMSSPLTSSNPGDYIRAHERAYEEVLKYGGEEALTYMLSQFQQNKAEGLRGHIMMLLCKELLGERNNVTNEALSPMEWFNQLSIRNKVDLPDFVYGGSDPIKKLVYETEVQNSKSSRGEFTIVAPHIFGSYEEGNKLKVFVTTFSQHYYLYDKTLSVEGGSVIPVAITFVKNSDGGYTLEKYEQAGDGSYFGPSIKDYCTMPVSGNKISGLSNKILSHYGKYEDIIKLERENLIQHLKANNQYGVFLSQKNYGKPDELIPIT